MPNDPMFTLRVPKSHALFYMAAMGKVPLEQSIDAFMGLREEIVRNERELAEPAQFPPVPQEG